MSDNAGAQEQKRQKTASDSLDEAVLAVLQQSSGSLIPGLDALIATHGVADMQAWRLNNKHKHALVHELVNRRKAEELEHVVQHHGFDINIHRESDQCTPLHLAGWTKQPSLMALCVRLGADAALKNKYGEDGSAVLATAKKAEHIAWLDLELTHLPGEQGDDSNAILEVALVITTPAFEELARGSWVVHHSPETLQGLSEWHQTNFKRVEEGGNGLLAAVQASALGKEEVEQAVLAMLREHGSEKCTRLAGNSVHCDREVLRATMPGVYAFVSHQVMDVSTVVNLTRMWMPTLGAQIPPALGYDHRASNDIDASIAMMQWFKDHLFRE